MVNSQSKHLFVSCAPIIHQLKGVAETPRGHCNYDGIWLVGKNAFISASKIYGPLFIFSALVSKKLFDPKFVAFKLIPSICRSSLFIAVIGALWVRLTCLLREITGAHYRLNYFLSPLIASSIGLLIEKKERRNELTVYICQQAVEGVFRMGESRGLWKPIKHGLTFLFATALGLLLYYRQYEENVLSGSTKGLLNLCIGLESRPDFIEVKMSKLYNSLKTKIFGPISEPPKHQLCHHSWSCRAYVLVGFMKSFSLGVLVRAALVILPLVMSPVKLLHALKKPKVLSSIFKLGLFLGIMSGGSRAVTCSLRATRGKEDGLNQFLGGFIAGFAFLLNGSTEIAMYVASKAAESTFYHLVNCGWLKSLPYGEVVAFALSCGILFNNALYEPHNVRPSYIKFLTRASGGKYAAIAKCFKPIVEEYGVPNPAEYEKWNTKVKKFFEKY